MGPLVEGINYMGTVVIIVSIDPVTGFTKVYIPLINQPSPDPVVQFDPSVAMATVTAVVILILTTADLI